MCSGFGVEILYAFTGADMEMRMDGWMDVDGSPHIPNILLL